jgi:NADH-quinone oxidoreductase subunit L
MDSPLHSLIVLLPLFGALIIGLGGFLSPGFRKAEKAIGYLATLMVFIPFCIVAYTFFAIDGNVEFGLLFGHPLKWMGSDNHGMLNIAFSYRLDHLSLLMALIVTGVGSLIHLYSTAYMHHDRGYYKFFLYLNLFIFAMLNLILGNNLAVVFLGWEGVGACSYFLIGFWYENMNNAKAAQKAFVANRIGDFAMICAMMIVVSQTHSLDMQTILHVKLHGSATWLVPLLLFIAATGKSAQIPLYVWLPDAMAGPTPVSALIHAATMVTSGIYLIARLSALYSPEFDHAGNLIYPGAPGVMLVVSTIGAATAILAALIAVAQNDIKKVLAYSTVSQLGFMFMALGAGAYTTAIFHVMTHAFFKACLFLGSGSVIHAMDHMHTVDDPQDVRTMGGLKKYMKVTHLTFFVSTLAIAGIPGLAGFFSKDEILSKVFGMGDNEGLGFWYYLIYGVGICTAALTAFYMTRVYFLTFRGKERFPHDHHPHESPWPMTVPLLVLGFLAIVGGYLGLPEVMGEGVHKLNIFLSGEHGHGGPVVGYPHENHPPMVLELCLIALSILIAAGGVLFSWRLYSKHDLAGDSLVQKRLGKLYTSMQNKFYVDEIYERLIIQPFVAFGRGVIMGIDKYVIDGFVNGLGTVTMMLGQVIKRLQTGYVGHYALLLVVGMLAILTYLIFV